LARRSKKKSPRKTKGRGAAGERGRFGQLAAAFLMGEPLDEETSSRVRELGGILLIAASLWLILSMATFYTPATAGASGTNLGGSLGYHLAFGAFTALGLSGYLLAVLGVIWGGIIVGRKEVSLPFMRVFGVFVFVVSFAFVLDLAFDPPHEEAALFLSRAGDSDAVRASFSAELPYGPGGYLAMAGNVQLVERFGEVGLWILLIAISIISALLATEMAFYTAITAFGEWLDEREERMGERFLPAVGGWIGRLCIGLWDFLRGADLAPAGAATAKGKRGSSSRKKASPKKKSAPKKAAKAKPRPKKAKADALLDLDELEDEDDLFTSAEADDEDDGYEYEYVDEDGNPIDPADLDAYDDVEGDDEDEWEYEDEEDEYDDEYEYEDDDVLEPVARGGAAADDEESDDAASAKAKRAAAAAVKRMASMSQPIYEPPTPPPGPWELPSFDLLEEPQGGATVDKEFLETAAQNLENALRSFRVESEVVGAQVGPAVTMFELTVAQGTRMNKVTALSQEIAATLKARSIRIIAPIPGKSTIGIEVPNSSRRTVRISELVTQKAYDKDHMALPLFLGMDAEGKSIVEDLARAPHMLIAGTTGSGKSVCINTVIASFLLTRSPHDVKLILIDPKMVELQMFHNIPHLELPVVTDMKQATNVLLWAVEKMESRYELFKNAGVKNIKTYNKLGEEKLRERLGEDFNEDYTPRHVPYIVLVIDEMADLMMQSKKEAEQAITRLAQKSRAVGIHVIVATQRPSTDVITGVIKGNLPTRIAFQVASKVDSRVILDHVGAEKLLGQGDMLYTPPQSSQTVRVQGALVEDHELQALVDHVTRDAAPNFDQQLVQTATGTAPPGEVAQGGEKVDEMFNEAVTVVLKYQRGSASLLQRALGIGYTRASRLIDQMTDAGILGPHKGSKSREIFMTLEDWEENQRRLEQAS